MRLFVTTFSGPEDRRAAQLIERGRQLSFTLNSREVVCYEWGNGDKTALLVHGWGGRATSLWAMIEPLIEAGYRVVGLDAPAHGRSEGKTTNLPEFANAILQAANDFGPFDTIVAHSFGGMCTARALQKGLAAGKVVCIASPAKMDFLMDSFSSNFRLPPSVRRNVRKRMHEGFGDDVFERLSVDATARDLTIPALFIYDTDDTDVPLSQGQVYVDTWKGSQYIETQGLGHILILRNKEVIKTVVEFALQ